MMVDKVRRTRNRTKQTLPLKSRLEQAARAAREAARKAQFMGERETQLRAAKRFEVTAHFVEWLERPGRSPPPY